MSDILDLVELQSDDQELVPEILPVEARLSVRGPVQTFLTLFERASSVIPVKETLPGTMYAQFEAVSASGGSVAHARITASNGDQSLSVVAEGLVVTMAGSALLPGRKIHEILRSAPESTVKIEVLGNTATIRSGRAQWTVETPVGDTLPPLPDTTAVKMHSVPTGSLLEGLVVARAAASATSARPSLMQIRITNGAATGTDGGRLHRQTIQGFPKDLTLDIPIKACDELIKALKATESAYVEVGGNNLFLNFHFGQDYLIAQRLLVAFPNVEPLILGPAFSNTAKLIVDRLELRETVKRVRINSDPDYSTIFMSIVPGKVGPEGVKTWGLAVRARDRVGNTAQEVIDVQWDGADKIPDLCVNHKYLTEFLSAYLGDDCIFRLGDDIKSVRNPLYIEDKTLGFTGLVQQMTPSFAS